MNSTKIKEMLRMLAETKKKNFGEQKQVYVKSGTVKTQFFRSNEIMTDPFTNKLSITSFESLI